MTLHLEQLRYLSAAAEARSFRRAAAMLDVQQSSISRAIRQLEDHLGVSLFERDHTGVRLTGAGLRFLKDALPAMQQLELARRTAEAAGRADLGVVRIGILTSLAGGFLRRLIRSYVEKHPDVSIDVRDGGRREHLAAVRAHRLDVAFVAGTGPVHDCETAELWRERVYVALPHGHALAAQRRLDWPQLKHEHFIVSKAEPGPEVYNYIVRRASDYSNHPEVEQKEVLQETLLNLVALGQGITLVSAAWTAVRVPGLALVPLTARADVVPFSAVWSSASDNPALRRLLSVAHVLSGRHRKGCSDWAISVPALAAADHEDVGSPLKLYCNSDVS